MYFKNLIYIIFKKSIYQDLLFKNVKIYLRIKLLRVFFTNEYCVKSDYPIIIFIFKWIIQI